MEHSHIYLRVPPQVICIYLHGWTHLIIPPGLPNPINHHSYVVRVLSSSSNAIFLEDVFICPSYFYEFPWEHYENK